MTVVAICQPTYLPWLGLLDMIDQCDVWVFLDTVPLEKQSWQTRNRILDRANNVQWLSVPVHAANDTAIKDVRVDRQRGWQRKHLRSLEQAYGACEHWKALAQIRDLIDWDWELLADLTTTTTVTLARTLGIQTPFHLASELGPGRDDRHGRIADILHAFGATEFLEPAGGRAVFGDRIEGVPIRYHDYLPAEYRQNRRGEFVSHLSVVDCLARHGAKRTLEIIRAGR